MDVGTPADLGSLPGLTIRVSRDLARVRSDWSAVDDTRIAGVGVRHPANVITGNGCLTEAWRSDWCLDELGVDQVFQRVLDAGAVSAWHVHLTTTDRLFCALGELLLVLFDARAASPTAGAVSEHRFGERRPKVVSVPPGVVHGVQVVGQRPAVLLNAVDRAYRYDDPDHYRIPADSPDVPYRF